MRSRIARTPARQAFPRAVAARKTSGQKNSGLVAPQPAKRGVFGKRSRRMIGGVSAKLFGCEGRNSHARVSCDATHVPDVDNRRKMRSSRSRERQRRGFKICFHGFSRHWVPFCRDFSGHVPKVTSFHLFARAQGPCNSYR